MTSWLFTSCSMRASAREAQSLNPTFACAHSTGVRNPTLRVNECIDEQKLINTFMAGDEGFEPPIAEPESAALPLG